MRKELYINGTEYYMSPQMLAKYVANMQETDKKLAMRNCEKYLPKDGKYSPCKSDVYSIAIMICELAGMERD